ncbi:hypothetical protein Tco_0158460 [Tanacetum coccineum]
MKLMQFLIGLDDTYMQIKCSILSRETLPDVKSTYAIISNKESHRVETGNIAETSHRSQTSAFTANVHNIGNYQRSQTSNNVPRPSNTVSSNSMIHSKLESKGVITDFGANQHITFTGIFLVNVIDISHLKIKVSHPNGTEAFITKIGNMPLTDYLTLFDVLVVPEYCVSLMSMHKVARDSKLIIAFDELKCYILNQDLRARKVLGTGRQFSGLYHFDGTQDSFGSKYQAAGSSKVEAAMLRFSPQL